MPLLEFRTDHPPSREHDRSRKIVSKERCEVGLGGGEIGLANSDPAAHLFAPTGEHARWGVADGLDGLGGFTWLLSRSMLFLCTALHTGSQGTERIAAHTPR